MKVLHIGCGSDKEKGAIGLDIDPKSDADVIHDLNKFPYPFKAGEFDRVIAIHVLEHLDNIPAVVKEIHRLLKPGGRVFVKTPHFASADMFSDPTHKRFFSSRSFDYFIPGTHFADWHYADVGFKKINVTLGPLHESGIFLKPILQLINTYPIFYERRFAFIFPVGMITFELEKI